MLANAKVVVTLQYTNVPNQHIGYLKLSQCYMSAILQWKTKPKQMGKK